MSTQQEGKPTIDPARHGSSPVVSTRYDHVAVTWAMAHLKVSKGDLVRRALDRLMSDLGLRTTRATEES
jgi:hypothetical protein